MTRNNNTQKISISGACSAELIAVSSILTYDVYKVSKLKIIMHFRQFIYIPGVY